jgi:uncharacterized protein
MAAERGFEWDENKRLLNIQNHGIDFVDAKDVFSDPIAYTYSSKRPASEPRYVTVGLANEVLVAVVFTRRHGRVRIISARVARHSERRLYGREEPKQKEEQ